MATTNNPTKQMSSNNLVIVMILITLLVVGGSVLVGKSLVTHIIRDAKVVGAKDKANKQLTANLEAAPKLVEEYKALGDKATLLGDALPSTPDLPALLVVMENIAIDSGLRLRTVAPVLAATTEGETAAVAQTGMSQPELYPFSVTFDGPYDSLRRFLANVELSARPIRVVGLQLNGSGSSLTGTIELQTYYQAAATLPFSTETIQ